MRKIKKILAPTDLSEFSQVGLRYAFESAHALGAELTVLHVIAVGEDWFAPYQDYAPVRDLLEERKRMLDKFLRDSFPQLMNLVEVRQVVEIGAPHTNIVQLAEREGIDMIVMSTHGRTGLDHFLMGSVTEKVMARASCPVLAIPPAERARMAKAA
ncbi:MAG TPA: universal stress protein [candidate division Zixibacteria bacterium]|nr:universal stress protein [candidate division Zixibacteria bacterium]